MNPTLPNRSVEEAVEILDVQLEGLFNDAVRQVLRFIRKEQTELELKAELKSLSDFALKGIRKKLTSLHTLGIEAGRREGMNLEKVTRFEVIDHRASYEEGGGRVFTARGEDLTVSLSLQDDERTLKVFLTPQ